MYVQPLESPISPNSLASPVATAEGTISGGGGAPVTGDNISRFTPPWLNDGGGSQYGEGYGGSGSLQGGCGSLMSVLQQLMQMLQSLMGYGCNAPYGSTNCPPGNERFFQNANGASDGDPHLSFNGQTWNNMASQPNLLDSDSIAGGFRVSTQVTSPNDKGVTWNQSATVALNNGATTVSMNNNGEASITSYGQSVSIARGQTLQLGDGESVTYGRNGSLQVCAENGNGGRIQTTLTAENRGVNVDVSAHGVDLGGTLVHGYEEREPQPTPVPVSGPTPTPIPYSGPTPTPIPYSGPTPTPIPEPYPITQPLGPEPLPVY